MNTAYPATCYLKGYLNTLGVNSNQMDLGLELFLRIFSSKGLHILFDDVEKRDPELGENAFRIYSMRDKYIALIDYVISFLQRPDIIRAKRIVSSDFLPRASRFKHSGNLNNFFGRAGVLDQAKYLTTLMLEDLGDFIEETIDPYFGFSRYAESLGSSLNHFDPMEEALSMEASPIISTMWEILEEKLLLLNPDLVGMTIPFPGNLLASLRCGQFLKRNYPHVKIAIGGGYCNTELRKLTDERIFNYVDFILLDDGEIPVKCLLEYLEGNREVHQLKRTYISSGRVVQYCNGAIERDVAQREVGTPDYGDLLLDQYLSLIDLSNPMHRLWSDGRWNKLTMAHGCYWGKCTFCDITLDYIQRYEPVTAEIICDRMERLMSQTNSSGFHFVDEAAPPALMRNLAIEILRRNLIVTWWANIRFEKSFNFDLCRLLAASGCIAVSGGLEVASNRLLAKIRKGVSVEQVTTVCKNFRDAGILVHAYLMYGFPTQDDQETVDSLEVVRQMFKEGIIQSGFWHQLSVTAHSPLGQYPSKFEIEVDATTHGGFALNDLDHREFTSVNHEKFSLGLRLSIQNYMQFLHLDDPVQTWFDFDIPRPTVGKNYIANILKQPRPRPLDQALSIWIGGNPSASYIRGKRWILEISSLDKTVKITLSEEIYHWFISVFPGLLPEQWDKISFKDWTEKLQELNHLPEVSNGSFITKIRETGLIFC